MDALEKIVKAGIDQDQVVTCERLALGDARESPELLADSLGVVLFLAGNLRRS